MERTITHANVRSIHSQQKNPISKSNFALLNPQDFRRISFIGEKNRAFRYISFKQGSLSIANVRRCSYKLSNYRLKCQTFAIVSNDEGLVNYQEGGEDLNSESLQAIYGLQQTYKWKGNNVAYIKESSGLPVLLIHGFGASIGHWRSNIPVLSQSCTVYALDLLGQGASDKPMGFSYTIESWAELITDFLRDVVGEPCVLVGNSIGSLVALTASAAAPAESLVRGTILLNCAGGMNNKAIMDDWRIRLAYPIFLLIDWLLLQPKFANWIFSFAKNKENIQSVLKSVYSHKERVDDELVQIIKGPAETEGALNAFVSIITGPPGPRPESLVPKLTHKLLVIWGTEDPFTPLDGPVGKYFRSLHSSNMEFVEVEGVGHCPHDDRPEFVNETVIRWIQSLSD